MNIKDEIARLPKHYDQCLIPVAVEDVTPVRGSAVYWMHEAHVYRAELALARKWIEDWGLGEWQGEDTGRDALLAGIAPPPAP